MIILYAITGCVTLMFLVVILSGAIRAIRNPERYGPRAANPHLPGGRPAQSRTAGLTRAILDTFPVVKFGGGAGGGGGGGSGDTRTRTSMEPSRDKPDEDRDLEMARVNARGVAEDGVVASTDRLDNGASGSVPPYGIDVADDEKEKMPGMETDEDKVDVINVPVQVPFESKRASGSSSIQFNAPDTAAVTAPSSPLVDHTLAGGPSPPLPTPTASTTASSNIDPLTVDDQLVCPICVEEWQDGDDLRVLPCDSRHRFHRECIDPWLLNVSSLCPLCRLDLSKSKRVAEEGDESEHVATVGDHPETTAGDGSEGDEAGPGSSSLAAAQSGPRPGLPAPAASTSFASNLRAIWASSSQRLSSSSHPHHGDAPRAASGNATTSSSTAAAAAAERSSQQQQQQHERTRFTRYLAVIRSGAGKATRRTSASVAAAAAAAASDLAGPPPEPAVVTAAPAATFPSDERRETAAAESGRGVAGRSETERDSSAWLASTIVTPQL
jgi:Ring finger domain